MNLLNNYLIELNSYPTFKKSKFKRFLDSNIARILAVSFVLLFLKISAEYVAEWVLFS